MVDITAKRGPIDPNDYTNNQGVATQTMLKRLEDDIEYEQNKPSTWDTIVGGIKDVVGIAQGIGGVANSFKDLDVKDENIKVAEEQIEASKVNRQKAELDMERIKQDMRMKSIQFDMALKEKQDENDAINNIITFMEGNDDVGLNTYLGEHAKSALLLSQKYPSLFGAISENFQKRTDREYRTDMLDLFQEMGVKPGDKLKNQLTMMKIAKTNAEIAYKKAQTRNELLKNQEEDSGDMFGLFDFSGGGGSSKSKNKKANPTMANEYVKFESDMSDAFTSISQYKNDTTGINGNILGAMTKLGYSMNEFKDMGYFIQTANIEVLDANNAYNIKKIQDILENKEDSKFLPKGIDIEAFTPDSKSGLEGKSIVKFSNSKGTAFIAVDKPTADIWRGLKSKQLTLRNLQNEYKQATGKDVPENPLLGDPNNPIIDTNLQAERFVKSMGQPNIVKWYNNASYEKQRDYIEQLKTNITKSGNTKDVVDYVIYGNDLENNPEWDAKSLKEFRDTMEAKYKEFRKDAPGKNIAEQRMAVNNDLLQFILTETSKGTSLEDIRNQILEADTSRELAWELGANDKIAAIDTLIEQAPDTEVEINDLPTPSYLRKIEQGAENIGEFVANIPSKVLPVPEYKGLTIPVKEVPSYVTKRFINEDVRNLLIEQEVNNLIKENDRNTGSTTAPATPKLRKEAEKKVDKAIYDFIVRARAKKIGDKTISYNLNLLENIEQLPLLLNHALSMWESVGYNFNTRDNWRANQLRKQETSKRVKKALKD